MKYDLDTIDRMRAAILATVEEPHWLSWNFSDNGSGVACGPAMRPEERATIVEERLRTYMLAEIPLEELEKAADLHKNGPEGNPFESQQAFKNSS